MTILESLHYLAKARQADPDAETLEVYLTALESHPAALIARACWRLGEQQREAYGPAMPVVGDILAMARTIRTEDEDKARKAIGPLIADESDPSTWFKCRFCEDVKWQLHDCPGGDNRTCGRSSRGYYDSTGKTTVFVGSCRTKHVYARRCVCAA